MIQKSNKIVIFDITKNLFNMNKILKWSLIVVGGLLVVGFVGMQILKAYTKPHSPAETITLESNIADVSITYSRPYKKDRQIFGGLVPYGEVWRTGANEATVFKTDKDITIDGKVLAAGSYTLWTIPAKESWVVIFNSETGQWGVKPSNGEANRDPANDVLITKVEVFPTGETVEQFTIDLEDGEGTEIVMSWENALVIIPFEL